jgi:hypothetical protein
VVWAYQLSRQASAGRWLGAKKINVNPKNQYARIPPATLLVPLPGSASPGARPRPVPGPCTAMNVDQSIGVSAWSLEGGLLRPWC